MTIFKLLTAVTVLILSPSVDVSMMTSLSKPIEDTQTNNHPSVGTVHSLALFMPVGKLITTDVVKSNDEGC